MPYNPNQHFLLILDLFCTYRRINDPYFAKLVTWVCNWGNGKCMNTSKTSLELGWFVSDRGFLCFKYPVGMLLL